MSKNKKNEKYCPKCKKWLPKVKFALEGKDRFDKDGERARRRTCSPCVWKEKKLKQEAEKNSKEEIFSNLTNALIELSRHDLERLESIDEISFVTATKAYEAMEDFDFAEIKKKAEQELYNAGLHRQEHLSLKPGTYIVVGDSHGNHTRNKMFDLLEVVSQHLNVDNIIHVGHMLDDDNKINHNWQRFDNVILVSNLAETRIIEEILDKDRNDEVLNQWLSGRGIDQEHLEEYKKKHRPDFDFNIVRKEVSIGDVIVANQYLIRDFVKTSISRLDSAIFKSSIVNLHRVEMDYRLSDRERHFVMSPGCMCEKHIIKTIKQIDFTTRPYTVKISYSDSFIKYRRMRHMYEYWQQGMVVVHYDGETVTSVPLRIHNIDGEYVTSYNDEIITSSGIEKPERKIFVNADIHVEYHDGDMLQMQEEIVKDYKPDVYVNLGDTANGSALNHHRMDRREVILEEDIVREFGVVNYIINRTAKWADEKYILFGNHERFLRDYTDKFPQLKSLINFETLSGLNEAGYTMIDLKRVLEIGGMHFLHGDTIFYGKSGTKMERASSSYGPSIVGHVHYPSTRFESHSVGLSAKYDHGYNEPDASRWTRGFLKCNQYKGYSFVLNYAVPGDKVIIGDKVYEAKDGESWTPEIEGIDISYRYKESSK